MTGPTMKILYGPPGTGKTWQAAHAAVKAVEPEKYSAALHTANPTDTLRELHRQLVEDGRIVWVTFHPSYAYEDFVEGYRPILGEGGQLAYSVVDGPFKKLSSRARFYDDLQIGEELVDGTGRTAGVVVDKDAGGWVIRVRPNRSDSVAETLDKYVPRYVIEKILDSKIPLQLFSIPGKGTFKLSDYGLSPSDADVPDPQENETESTRTGPNIRRILAARSGIFSSTDLTNASHFGWVAKKIAAKRASSTHSYQTVALVIDEINRAEVSRVFGELLTLLEPDKRLGMTEERKVWLPYSKALFGVPEQLSVIGTMNTVDRSLTALDFAMRRRFEFQYVPADPTLVPDDYAGINLRIILTRVNSRIASLLGSGFEIGHSHLMVGKLNSTKQHEGWNSLSDGELRAVAFIVRTSILPTIMEYFRGDLVKIGAVISKVRSQGTDLSLLDKARVDSSFLERLADDYEFSDIGAETPAEWWNPHSIGWAPAKFREFLAALSAGH